MYEADKAAWKKKWDEYTKEIAKARINKWKEFVNNAEGKTIWQVQKYIDNAYTTTFVPPLEGQATSHE